MGRLDGVSVPADELVHAAAGKAYSWSMWGRYLGEHCLLPAKVSGE